MKSALLMLDIQNGFTEAGDFSEVLSRNQLLANYFQQQQGVVIMTRHIDSNEKSLITDQTHSGELHASLQSFTHKIIEKQQPSAFLQTDLDEYLKTNQITQLVVTGFNVEYCCLFNSIIAHEKGYQVTFIEDASATVNTDQTYEMPGLDIRDFIATLLDWSGTIKVMDTEEYIG
ncbi:isochorismatase family protein [Alkalihalobacillus sp. NPDC078783]